MQLPSSKVLLLVHQMVDVLPEKDEQTLEKSRRRWIA